MKDLYGIYEKCGISREIFELGEEVNASLAGRFKEFDRIAEYNQLKVLGAMQKCRVSEACFVPSTGYGYNDLGRDTLEQVYACVFGTEDALVRPQLVCGTHAIATAISSQLRPGDNMVSISGRPYDTLEEVIGIRKAVGSLEEYGISYDEVDLNADGSFDTDGIRRAIKENTKLVAIQRSKGYKMRPSLSVESIGEVTRFVKSIREDITVMVDNCYGEFTDISEPSDLGADMIAGSLIKNPGGGLAPMGGYIAGTRQCIEKAAYRLTSPGLGREVGATLDINRTLFQGLFLAPSVTNAALKGAVFAANLYDRLGFEVYPGPEGERNDIIQAVKLGSPEAVIAFCNGIQSASPVDSYLAAMPSDMPGYDSEVIMAAGAFVSGSSIELSADAPMRPPYTVYFQGGLTWHHARFGILKSLQKLVDEKIVSLC